MWSEPPQRFGHFGGGGGGGLSHPPPPPSGASVLPSSAVHFTSYQRLPQALEAWQATAPPPPPPRGTQAHGCRGDLWSANLMGKPAPSRSANGANCTALVTSGISAVKWESL